MREHARMLAQIKSHIDELKLPNGESTNCRNGDPAQPNSDDSSEGFPYISALVVFTGCISIVMLIIKELKNFKESRSQSSIQRNESEAETESEEVTKAVIEETSLWIQLGEFLQYRVDTYFSESQIAKPALLLVLSFIIIFISSISMMILGDDFGVSFWRAWTYVADSGNRVNTLHCFPFS